MEDTLKQEMFEAAVRFIENTRSSYGLTEQGKDLMATIESLPKSDIDTLKGCFDAIDFVNTFNFENPRAEHFIQHVEHKGNVAPEVIKAAEILAHSVQDAFGSAALQEQMPVVRAYVKAGFAAETQFAHLALACK